MARKKEQPVPGKRALRGRPSFWLYLVRIHCTKTEDTTGADEVYLTVNGFTRWGIVSMNNNDSQDLEATTEPVRFRNSVAVEVWDNDTGIFDSDDRLGRVIIAPDASTLDQEAVAEFTDDGARYELTYVVSAEGP